MCRVAGYLLQRMHGWKRCWGFLISNVSREEYFELWKRFFVILKINSIEEIEFFNWISQWSSSSNKSGNLFKQYIDNSHLLVISAQLVVNLCTPTNHFPAHFTGVTNNNCETWLGFDDNTWDKSLRMQVFVFRNLELIIKNFEILSVHNIAK